MTKEQKKIYMLQYRIDHAERIKETTAAYLITHKQEMVEKRKIAYEKCKDIKNQKRRENRAKTRPQATKYVSLKIKTDPIYKLRHLLRTRTLKAFKSISANKPDKTHILLGSNYLTIKEHIEKQFKDGMTWENHGKWHIDHIIPLGSTKDPEKLKSLCHYTNLQPLWAKDNLAKRNIINYHAA